ncbi:MAG TPA: hypothetical protein VK659_01280 [Asanoa sp.]|nr:hypothetical protein [Asanoa sp.]
MSAAAELERRVAHLDAELGDTSPEETFSWVVGLAVDEISGSLPPEAADAIVSHSRLLARLRKSDPTLVDGPLRTDSQLWIAAAKPPHLPVRFEEPSRDHFVEPRDAGPLFTTKPFEAGLFTSTATGGRQTPSGMWLTYLRDHGGSRGGPFPYPWHVWTIEPKLPVMVFEVTNAVTWVDLVRTFPSTHGGLLYPDWVAIAQDWDAVHMTAAAVAATHGLRMLTTAGTMAAPFWDVESTLWLRWCFQQPRLISTIT